jgi:tol-pal system protein YbgF
MTRGAWSRLGQGLIWSACLLPLGGCASQLRRIETGVQQVAQEQQSQSRAMQQFQDRLDALSDRDAKREEQLAERRAELEAQLLALDRAVRQMDARSEEQATLLQQIRAALDLISRQGASRPAAEDDATGTAPTTDTADASGVQSASPGTDVYESAFADYTRGSYTLARQGFEELLRRFPDSELADDAAYWIAETHYAQGDPETALSGFQSILEEYPRGDSITPALLKIGYCYLELHQNDKARDAFRHLLREFPESDEAKIAQHKLESMDTGSTGG